MSISTTPVLLIAGMHRSGTTLTANWLNHCGLDIGDQLLITHTKHANPSGEHFEDLDFLNFHKSIIRDNGYSEEGYITTQDLQITDKHRELAKEILRQRNTKSQWGWKEPRTTLLIEFWKEMIPNIKVFAVYRRPDSVVNSLIRRKIQHPKWYHRLYYRLRFFPMDRTLTHFYNIWNRYNQEIISFAHRYPDQILVLEISNILDWDQALIAYFSSQWGFDLDAIPASEIFMREKLQSHTLPSTTNSKLQHMLQQCQDTYSQLNALRDATIESLQKAKDSH